MKKILQASALIILTASLVYTGASSHQLLQEKCNREWESAIRHHESAEEKPSIQQEQALTTKSLFQYLIY